MSTAHSVDRLTAPGGDHPVVVVEQVDRPDPLGHLQISGGRTVRRGHRGSMLYGPRRLRADADDDLNQSEMTTKLFSMRCLYSRLVGVYSSVQISECER